MLLWYDVCLFAAIPISVVALTVGYIIGRNTNPVAPWPLWAVIVSIVVASAIISFAVWVTTINDMGDITWIILVFAAMVAEFGYDCGKYLRFMSE